MAEILLRAENLQLRFAERTVLDDVSLTIKAGEIVTLIGPNGAGKTSLVRVVLGLVKPNAGNIIRVDKLKIGYMPQKLHIDPSLPLSVERFLMLAGKRSDLDDVSHLTGICHLRQQPIQKLSGGETKYYCPARYSKTRNCWYSMNPYKVSMSLAKRNSIN